MSNIYKYRSPYRPLLLNYIPNDIHWLFELSDVGEWTPKSIYAFNKPLPVHLIEQWSLELVNEA